MELLHRRGLSRGRATLHVELSLRSRIGEALAQRGAELLPDFVASDLTESSDSLLHVAA